jgi:hypothetical protein
MSDEPKKPDPVIAPWQPVAVVSLEVEPKRLPARSLKNAAWDIGWNVALASIVWGGLWSLPPRWGWTAVLRHAGIGAILGLLIGISSWLRRPPNTHRTSNPD